MSLNHLFYALKLPLLCPKNISFKPNSFLLLFQIINPLKPLCIQAVRNVVAIGAQSG